MSQDLRKLQLLLEELAFLRDSVEVYMHRIDVDWLVLKGDLTRTITELDEFLKKD